MSKSEDVTFLTVFCSILSIIIFGISFGTSVYTFYHLSHKHHHKHHKHHKNHKNHKNSKHNSKHNPKRKSKGKTSNKDDHKHHETHPLMGILTKTSVTMYQLFSITILISIFLMQFGLNKLSIYIVTISLGFLALGKQSMYALFAYRLHFTFQQSIFSINPHILRIIIIAIIINLIIYSSETYWYLQYRFNNDYTLWFLAFVTIPIDFICSVLISGNFAARLLQVESCL